MEISFKNTKQEIWEALQDARQKLTVKPTDEEKKEITVVVPYVAAFAQGIELQLAVRSWAKNFKEDFNLVVIGDRTEWMSESVINIKADRFGNNPPIDIARKMMLAIESPAVSEKFVWTNDDQYLVSPVMMVDLEFLKCTGVLETKNLSGSLYHNNKAKTYQVLKQYGKSIWDYSSHTPFVFEKEKLAYLIKEFNLTENALLIATLYYNWYFPEFVPYNVETQYALEYDNLRAGVYRSGADLERLKRLIPHKKLVGNSQTGYSKALEQILLELFPEKCQLEI